MSLSHFLLNLKSAANSFSSMDSYNQFNGPNHLGGSLVFTQKEEYSDDAEDIEDEVMEDPDQGESIMKEETVDL